MGGTPRSGFKSGAGGGGSGGSGDVTGPASSTDHAVVRFDGAGGKTLQDSGVIIDDSDNVTGVTTLNKLTLTEPATGATITVADGVTLTVSNDTTLTGDPIGGSTGATDNAIVRADGTGGATVQAGASVFLSDAGVLQFGGKTNLFSGLYDGGSGQLWIVGAADGTPAAWGTLRLSNTIINQTYAQLQSTATKVFGGGPQLGSAAALKWTSSTDAGAGSLDTGMSRESAGVIRATDGSTGIGALLSSVLVEANTATSGTPNSIAATESGTTFTNEGATAANYHTLPTAAAGYQFTFICQDADGIRVTASTGDNFQCVDFATASGGYLESTTIGSVLTVVSVNATEWFVTAIHGVWTDGTTTWNDTGLST